MEAGNGLGFRDAPGARDYAAEGPDTDLAGPGEAGVDSIGAVAAAVGWLGARKSAAGGTADSAELLLRSWLAGEKCARVGNVTELNSRPPEALGGAEMGGVSEGDGL